MRSLRICLFLRSVLTQRVGEGVTGAVDEAGGSLFLRTVLTEGFGDGGVVSVVAWPDRVDQYNVVWARTPPGLWRVVWQSRRVLMSGLPLIPDEDDDT